jgi:hypothetical protein
MKFKFVICGFLLFLSSCDLFYLKPLDIHTVKKGDITARWFFTSSITTVHNHVELHTRRGWEQIMECNGYPKIYDVLIDKDTVVIETSEGMCVYQLESVYWGTYVRLDSSISDYQYHQKFPLR